MPAARIHLLAGHPQPALRQVLLNVSAALTTVLDTTADRVQVWVHEIDPGLWLVNGRPAGDALGDWPLAAVEVPVVEVLLVEGRPVPILQHLAREITEGVVHALGADRERVRVLVHSVDPDLWTIGGIPVTLQRAESLSAARLRQTP